jgi:hypothetical protein
VQSNSLYRKLVPGAPPHRRTEGDEPKSEDFQRRVAAIRPTMDADVVPAGLQAPRLVSSCAGSIDRILFCFPNWSTTSQDLIAGYVSVIRALRVGTHFIVVHHESARPVIQSWFEGAGHPSANVTYAPLPDYVGLTDWAEDAYVALADHGSGAPFLMEPWEFRRAGDALIADAVENHSEVRATQAPLIFQGGNCLVGDGFWMMGRDYFADTMDLLQGNRAPVNLPAGPAEPFVRNLYTRYLDSSRRLVLIGTQKAIPIADYIGSRSGNQFYLDIPTSGVGTFQPIFHIDMFLTLVGADSSGRFQVLVGSPALADQRLGTRSPFALQDVYDRIASELVQAGLAVRRNPIVHQPSLGRTYALSELQAIASTPEGAALAGAVKELIAAGAGGTTVIQVRSWHHITWNNCLVENSATAGKHVYLPTFGYAPHANLAVLDADMEALWTELGFTVHRLGNFNAFAERQGVVHCIKKYINRGS